MESDLNSNRKEILQMPPYSLEFPKPSYDDKFIVIEKYTQDELLDYTKQRDFVFETKPSTAELVVYDTQRNVLYQNGSRGINALWVR